MARNKRGESESFSIGNSKRGSTRVLKSGVRTRHGVLPSGKKYLAVRDSRPGEGGWVQTQFGSGPNMRRGLSMQEKYSQYDKTKERTSGVLAKRSKTSYGNTTKQRADKTVQKKYK